MASVHARALDGLDKVYVKPLAKVGLLSAGKILLYYAGVNRFATNLAGRSSICGFPAPAAAFQACLKVAVLVYYWEATTL